MFWAICGVAICTTCHLFGSLASCCSAWVVPAGIPEKPIDGVADAIPNAEGVDGRPIGCGYCPGEMICAEATLAGIAWIGTDWELAAGVCT